MNKVLRRRLRQMRESLRSAADFISWAEDVVELFESKKRTQKGVHLHYSHIKGALMGVTKHADFMVRRGWKIKPRREGR